MRTQGDLIELTTTPNEAQAGILRAVLEDAGIPSHLSVGGGVMANAEFGMTFVPTSIWVRKDDLDQARAVLEDNRSDSIDLDWDEVDVGELEDGTARIISPRAVQRRAFRRRFFYVVLAVMVAYILIMMFTMIGGTAWTLWTL
ncbi:MAG: DUF2007 domain-containing protein [Phycisphaerales bacterium]